MDKNVTLIPGGDLPVGHPSVFNIPMGIASRMLGYNRLGEDSDITSEDWSVLKQDISENGLKNAMAIGTIGDSCHLVSGNHRVHVLKSMGATEVPVFLSENKCVNPRNEVPMFEMLEKLKKL